MIFSIISTLALLSASAQCSGDRNSMFENPQKFESLSPKHCYRFVGIAGSYPFHKIPAGKQITLFSDSNCQNGVTKITNKGVFQPGTFGNFQYSSIMLEDEMRGFYKVR
jgi:hypothetical protein